ncbi:septum site-determining protein MinC [Desemzia sp. RIT804]|uniref:septum site-determining protein MinC n=1 Tax=Desemzia sp. RIT 804 TaxID=2810209 RepID=UPI0019513E72|nr:septum site-determining protein MinC [Desemzia sp. RIT 804]MBM6613546.1 septum site-determining protein MinC [Desemzia sp. RIT 804]
MKQNVTLKGIKEGFLLNLNDAASFEELTNELDELLDHLRAERKLSGETRKDIHLEIHSGDRLLNTEQKELLSKKIEEKSHFSIKSFDSNVLTYECAIEWQKKVSLEMKVQTVRSGQILEAPGDILLIGKVHPGGSIRAKGSIFIIGELHGVAHAGVDGDTSAVIVADFLTKAQIRIADNVEVIENEDEESKKSKVEVAYINDLHILSFETLDRLKKIQPSIDKVTGGLFE